jgi:hypothetical protein
MCARRRENSRARGEKMSRVIIALAAIAAAAFVVAYLTDPTR